MSARENRTVSCERASGSGTYVPRIPEDDHTGNVDMDVAGNRGHVVAPVQSERQRRIRPLLDGNDQVYGGVSFRF